eukprot:1332212-Amorphochlora_amoeboformis.AAC.1
MPFTTLILNHNSNYENTTKTNSDMLTSTVFLDSACYQMFKQETADSNCLGYGSPEGLEKAVI